MRKMPISKIDPTLAFSFYLRNEHDFRYLYHMMKSGKEKFKGDWPFSMMDIEGPESWMMQYYST